jgi:hypothetical protein
MVLLAFLFMGDHFTGFSREQEEALRLPNCLKIKVTEGGE